MRRRHVPQDDLDVAPDALLFYDPADWPPETAVPDPDEDGLVCLVEDEHHAGCRYWAAYRTWLEDHPDADVSLVAPGVDVGFHLELI